MGCNPAALQHAAIRDSLRQAGSYAQQRHPLPGFLLLRSRTLDLFLRCDRPRERQPHKQFFPHHQGVLPSDFVACVNGAGQSSGLRDRFGLAGVHDVLLSHTSQLDAGVLPIGNFFDGAVDDRRQFASGGDDGPVSGRQICAALPDSDLDVCNTDHLSGDNDSEAVPGGAGVEPLLGHGRQFSRMLVSPRAAQLHPDCGFDVHDACGFRRGPLLLSLDAEELRGHYLKVERALGAAEAERL
jgi:hypothetical protein